MSRTEAAGKPVRAASEDEVAARALLQAKRESPTAEVARFDGVERAVHWSTAILLLTLIVTGTILYVPTFAVAVSHRAIVENVHVVSGLLLLVPVIVGVLGPWRTLLVRDLRRVDRWSKSDWDWFRRRRKRRNLPRDKFNGGQKGEAVILGAGMTVMLITGVVMRWSPQVFPSNWATGATFVHDVVYIVLFLAVVGHIYFALSNPDQMKSMITGRIPRRWAKQHAAGWLDEVEPEPEPAAPAPPPRAAEPSTTADPAHSRP